jgi:biotin carboxyl carrier protein
MKKLICKVDGAERALYYGATPDKYEVDGAAFVADTAEVCPGIFSILIDGESLRVTVSPDLGTPETSASYRVTVGKEEFVIEVVDARKWVRAGGALQAEGSGRIAAPMAGKVVRMLVSQGQAVEAGQSLLVVEAMKMQNEIKSPRSGRVVHTPVVEGQAVAAGQELMVID